MMSKCLTTLLLLWCVVALEGGVVGEEPSVCAKTGDSEPELLGFSQCLTNTMCDYPQVPAVYGHNSFSVPVRYKGPGPFTVTWHRPNGEVNCNGLSNRCQIATNNTTNESVLTISHYADSDKGTYVARVSNSYGCNESHTIVYIDCPEIPNPWGPPKNSSTMAEIGQEAIIECEGKINYNARIDLCYSRAGEMEPSLNHGRNSCIECYPESGTCGTFNGKDWEVTRSSRTTALCVTNLVMTLTIPHVHKSDDGTVFYCSWVQGSSSNTYEINRMSVPDSQNSQPSYHKYYMYGGGGILFIVAGVAVTAVWFLYKKQRRRVNDGASECSNVCQDGDTQSRGFVYEGHEGCNIGETTPLMCQQPSDGVSVSLYGSSQETLAPPEFPSELLGNDHGAPV